MIEVGGDASGEVPGYHRSLRKIETKAPCLNAERMSLEPLLEILASVRLGSPGRIERDGED